MKYPCYKVKDEKEYRYIKTYLNSFGYNTKLLTYLPYWDYIVLNTCGKLGLADNADKSCINRYNRYETTNINEFLLIASKLKNTTFKQNKTKINMKNNKPQTVKPKIGDVVLVKNIGDKDYVKRIYLGTYKNKYITASHDTSNNFKECCNCVATFWDKMIMPVTVTKAQIANKFGVSVDLLEIVD